MTLIIDFAMPLSLMPALILMPLCAAMFTYATDDVRIPHTDY
jgi:hypothetical protein